MQGLDEAGYVIFSVTWEFAEQFLSCIFYGRIRNIIQVVHEKCLLIPQVQWRGIWWEYAPFSGYRDAKVPLLMADLVYLSASSRSEAVQKGEAVEYFLALAPRPQLSETHKLEDVWLMYTAAADSSDFLRLLFQFGSRGALRWDLENCYGLTERALGSGGCGTVYLGQSKMQLPPQKESSRPLDMPAVPQVAIKKLNKSGGLAEETSIRSEIEFLAVAKGHPNITALFGVFCHEEQDDPAELPRARWCIVMSLYSAGDLFDYLAANGAMPEPAAVTLMLCLLSALTHLHRLGVVHRDVKAENILCLGDDGHSLWPPLCIFLDFRSKTIEDDIFQLSALLGTEWLEYLESEYLLTSMWLFQVKNIAQCILQVTEATGYPGSTGLGLLQFTYTGMGQNLLLPSLGE